MTEIRSAEQRAGVCESVPYHLVSAVQPHAVLIAAEQGSLAVRRATRNVERLAGLSFPDLFGTPFQDLIEAESRDRLMRLLDSPGGPLHRGGRVATDLRFEPRLGGRSGVAVLYFSPPLLCIEFHPDIEEVRSGESLDTLLFRLVEEIAHFEGPSRDLAGAVCRALQAITGYDRLYLCEFDEAGHGYISAEHSTGPLPSLLHHHFPRTDVPDRVRSLYLRNPFRMIPDIDAAPILVEAADGSQSEPLDLTLSTCRQVAASHLQYVRNMGVRATVSFSVVAGGKLIGLFGGHSQTPRHIGYRRLAMAQHLVDLYRTRWSFLKLREQESALRQHMQLASELAAQFAKSDCRLAGFLAENGPRFLGLMGASDFIGRFDDQFCAGRLRMRDAQQIVETVCRQLPESGILQTDNIAGLAPQLASLSPEVSGCFAIALDAEGRNVLIWLRPENIVQQKWSGNPDEPILVTAAGGVGPRQSFETYLKAVNGRSLPWDEMYIELATAIAKQMNQVLSNYYNVKAREAAEQVSRLNSEFVSNVSHELRSPLHAIIGLAEAVLEKGEALSAEKRAQYKMLIKERGQRLLHLVNDLLDIAKLEARALQFTLARGDLRGVIDNSCLEVASLAHRKSITLRVEDSRSCRDSIFDAGRMTQVIVNLLLNAIKFSPPATVISIRLSDTGLDGMQNGFMIEVADQGVGVPDSERQNIFGKFVKSSRTEGAIPGVGLGLPISREIVLGHGGQLWVENNADGGASFFIYLPDRPPQAAG